MTTGAWTKYGSILGVYYTWTKSRTWNGTDKSSTGGLYVPHAYSCVHSFTDNGVIIYKPNMNTYTQTEMLGFGANLSAPAWSDSDTLKLLDKLGEQIRGHDFNAGVFAGTGAQTARLIADRATRIAAGLSALKKGKGVSEILDALGVPTSKKKGAGKQQGKAGALSDDMSQKWLEASYGWLPLVQDVDSAMEALVAHTYGVRQVRFKVSRALRKSDTGSDALRTWWNRAERSVVLQYRLSSASLPSTARDLGLLDPASVAWELLPWSFVIDWFLPIGSYLQAVNLFPHISGDWIRSERTLEEHRTFAIENATYQPVANSYKRTLRVDRTVGSGSISVPLPSFKSPLSRDWRRMANAIALLAGLKR